MQIVPSFGIKIVSCFFSYHNINNKCTIFKNQESCKFLSFLEIS